MSQQLDPITNRDFSAGRVTKATVATALVPANSVANAINVDFSEVIGSGIVRKGKTRIINFTGTMTDGQAERVQNSGDELHVYGANFVAQTFTPTSGQNTTYAFALKLFFVGSTIGLTTPTTVTISLTATSGGNPIASIINNNVWRFDAGTLTTNSAGQVYLFPTTPGTVLTTSTKYALVVEFDNGDSSDYVAWMRNSGTSYSGGQSLSSSNSGGSWSGNSGANYFAQEITTTPSTYNFAPLGNYSFLNANLKKNVLAYEISSSGLIEGAIFYYNVVASGWVISNLFNLNATAKVRFTNLNGSVFMANGVNLMKDSPDFGATWNVTQNDLFPYAVDTAQAWNSGVSYSTGNLVSYGGHFYISLVNSNSNNQPDNHPDDWSILVPLYPSLLIVSGNRMLASGVSLYPSRVYFSSLVDPSEQVAAGIFITWNNNASNGDFIDVDPDSGGQITGFANTSTLTLVFKNNAMYRLNAIAKSVDAENIFNVGAVSQEAITQCLGLTYFYSGQGIYQTDGTFPQPISRVGVQDFVDAITDASGVYAWNDAYNVYFSIGPIIMTFGPEDTRTYSNVVLKFSPRDQNWQIYTYDQRLAQGSLFGVAPTVTTIVQEYNGDLATVNSPIISDDGNAIPYDLETQELEFANRSHTKIISDQIVIFTRNGNEGAFSVKENDGNFRSANVTLESRVNVADDVNFIGEFFTFKWRGEALGSRPMLEGYSLPKITDEGVSKNGQP